MRPVLLALFVPALCVAQTQPRLGLDATTHDFGRIIRAFVVSHRFKATNLGTAPLTIKALKPSCGCTSTMTGKAILAPGEATELDVAFNPAGQYGVVYKTVTVESDDPVQPSQVLTIQAEILPEVIPSMDRVLLQDLVPADRRKVTVKLASGTGKPLSVATVELSEAPWLGVARLRISTAVSYATPLRRDKARASSAA